jgi:hypothetical protein
MLRQAVAGKIDIHQWVAGPDSKIGAGVLPVALRPAEKGDLDVPEIDLDHFRGYDPQYVGVMSPEAVTSHLDAYHAAAQREVAHREEAMGLAA